MVQGRNKEKAVYYWQMAMQFVWESLNVVLVIHSFNVCLCQAVVSGFELWNMWLTETLDLFPFLVSLINYNRRKQLPFCEFLISLTLFKVVAFGAMLDVGKRLRLFLRFYLGCLSLYGTIDAKYWKWGSYQSSWHVYGTCELHLKMGFASKLSGRKVSVFFLKSLW